jgi:hypothetical protein
VIVLMSLYVLVMGDFPGAAWMGVEEDSVLVTALLAAREMMW